MKLMSPEEVLPGDAVRLDVGDALLLGEVVHASRQECTAQQTWVVGVRFEQGIFGLAALKKLLAAIEGADSRVESDSSLRRL
jgi:hypothetical protein